MLSQANKDILKAFGIDYNALEAAIKSETETEITLPTGTLLTDEQLASRDTESEKRGKKAGEEIGKKTGFEIAHKLVIEKFGLKDVQKTDETTKVIEALYATVATGDTGLKKQVEDLLRDKEQLAKEKEQAEKKADDVRFEFTLVSKFPANRAKVLSDDKYLKLIKDDIIEVDGVKGLSINGEPIKDSKTRAVLPIDKAIEQYFTANKWIEETQQQTGGRGAGDSHTGGGKHRTYSEAEKAYIAEHGEGSNLGVKFQSYITELAKSPDFDINK